MGVRLRFCISHKLQGDADTGPWTHFTQQGRKGLVKFQSICTLLSPFTFFFSFLNQLPLSYLSVFILPQCFYQKCLVISFKMLCGPFFQIYSLIIAGHINSTQLSTISWVSWVSQLKLTILILWVLLGFLERKLPTFLTIPSATESQNFYIIKTDSTSSQRNLTC